MAFVSEEAIKRVRRSLGIGVSRGVALDLELGTTEDTENTKVRDKGTTEAVIGSAINGHTVHLVRPKDVFGGDAEHHTRGRVCSPEPAP